MKHSNDAIDSRDAFRVEQNLLLDYRQVSEHVANNQPPEDVFDQGQALGVLGQLKRIDREANQTLKILTDKNRLLGDYLQRLNAKVDLIARYTLFTSEQDQSTDHVSLSETGISFASKSALPGGEFLAMRLIFLPTYLPVIVFARVVRSIPSEGAYQIAAEFYKLCDRDRQELAKQVFKAQVQNRKKQEKSENY